MILAATLAASLAVPQLQIEPYRAEVGQEVAVTATRGGAAAAGAVVVAELPDGSTRTLGTTDGHGQLRFTAAVPGAHVLRTEVGGVRFVAPHMVVSAPPRWLVAAACVPLGLALLWRNLSRARDRRAP